MRKIFFSKPKILEIFLLLWIWTFGSQRTTWVENLKWIEARSFICLHFIFYCMMKLLWKKWTPPSAPVSFHLFKKIWIRYHILMILSLLIKEVFFLMKNFFHDIFFFFWDFFPKIFRKSARYYQLQTGDIISALSILYSLAYYFCFLLTE